MTAAELSRTALPSFNVVPVIPEVTVPERFVLPYLLCVQSDDETDHLFETVSEAMAFLWMYDDTVLPIVIIGDGLCQADRVFLCSQLLGVAQHGHPFKIQRVEFAGSDVSIDQILWKRFKADEYHVSQHAPIPEK